MKRASWILLTLLAAGAVASSSAMAAIPKGARVVDFRDYYKATADGLRLHGARETFIGAEGPKGGGKTRAVCADGIFEAMRVPGWRGMMFRQKYGTLLTSTLTSFWEVCPQELANVIVADHIASRGEIVFITGSKLFYRGLSGNVLQSELAVKQYLEDLKSLELCWFYINEGSQTRREFWDTLKQTLRFIPKGVDPRAIRYRGIVDTNPEPGWFHKTFVRGPIPADHLRVHFDPANNPGLAAGCYDRFADMPESWKAKYIRGEWTFDQEGDCWVFPLELVSAAMEREIPGDKDLPPSYGLDPAGMGRDEAVLCKRTGGTFSLRAWPKTTSPELVAHVSGAMNADGWGDLNGDDGGLGARDLDHLKPLLEARKKRLVRITTKGRSGKPHKYADLRTEMTYALRERMEKGLAALPDDDKLREQMQALQFTADSNQIIKVESKEDYKKRTGSSPDRMEAVIYANWKGPRPLTVGVQG